MKKTKAETGAKAKPARKSATRKRTTKKVANRLTAKPVPKTSRAKAEPSDSIRGEQRFRMIAEAAYYRAEKRRFIGGSDVEDWIAAEAEIDARLRRGES